MTQDAHSKNSPKSPQSTNPPVTILDEIVPGVAWQDGFAFGRGIDATTGALMQSALEPSTPVLQTDYTSQPNIRMVRSESDYQQEIDLSASGKYNVDGLTVEGSASYLSNVRFSDTSMTLIASWTADYGDYDRLPQPQQLSADARKMIDNSEEFRQSYGDYFINGGRRQSNFFALYVLQASSSQSLTQFNATIGASMPDVFDATVSAKFVASAQTNNVDISVQVFMSEHKPGDEGFKDGEYTPESVLDALAWFKANATGTYQRAELVHYCTLDRRFPRSVEVSLDFWGDLKNLDDTYANVCRLYDACPTTYQKLYTDDFNMFKSKMDKGRTEFAYNPDLLSDLQAKGNALAQGLGQIAERLDFYRTLNTMRLAGASTVSTADGPPYDQSYGYKQSPNPEPTAIEIQVGTVNCDHDWNDDSDWGDDGWGINWSGDGRLITGFEITNNWAGFGYINVAPSSSVLLSNSISMAVYPETDRGCSWTLSVYSVDAKDYDFAAALQSTSKASSK